MYSYKKTKKIKRIDNDKYLKILTKFYFRQLANYWLNSQKRQFPEIKNCLFEQFFCSKYQRILRW